MKILEELKKIVSKDKVDLGILFKNFDKNKNGSIDRKELYNLLRLFSKNVTI